MAEVVYLADYKRRRASRRQRLAAIAGLAVFVIFVLLHKPEIPV